MNSPGVLLGSHPSSQTAIGGGEPNLGLGARAPPNSPVHLVFSTLFRPCGAELRARCSQICNWRSLAVQQRSTTLKMQMAESKAHRVYTRKVTHLIPNQIPYIVESC